ncbi:alpha/beta hydrolase [Clostridium estertheticum]|uniref:Alpha/beta hydrolase n=1 Tax=Clostridium estertheticum TaxID=238834 RepID=A0A7Y3SSN9_9CLOT|nr:alpha/beta hydrolase [Clostridium estertheticum]MBW9173145.1 alpha/beta hydrolase [Clostridium estertheticum]NNU74380.1 alpha/beta hydrolase [Clostridium estertheticum]WBL49115.1 alpha/beta hydrolase [Clostridium estertheticum]WLC77209.1 alpha/beta hydrolase [Clostridium estertheticum]
MISMEGQRILQWLYKNVKNGQPAVTIEEARANIDAMANINAISDDIKIEGIYADCVKCDLVTAPFSQADKYILFLHGGGYCMGSSRTSLKLISQIISVSNCNVISVDYRLAPENPFPSALDDAVTAYSWLLSQGVSSKNIIIIGESAGGGLAVSLMLHLRDNCISLPSGAVLLSPWTDLVETGDSFRTCAETDPYYNSKSYDRKTAKMYSCNEDLSNPLISPLYANLQNLPKILIHVGTNDVLFNDSTRIEECLKNAGVEVTLKIWHDMWHVWHVFGERLPEAKQAIDEIGVFIKENLNIY